jgi:3-deoxy-D-manno-octulosonate 8-phosphate phosphatase (KDO 8-P phosphatase)
MTTLQERANAIRLVCTDVDGVLTTGQLHFAGDGTHAKAFHVRDGAATVYLQRCGIKVAFISGLDSPSTWARAKHLGVEDCFAGDLAKGPILAQLCDKYGLAPEQVAHLGDDLPDLPILRRVGLACCPEDAVEEVRAACHFIVPVRGGQGVLRPVAEMILKAQGLWDSVVAKYEE